MNRGTTILFHGSCDGSRHCLGGALDFYIVYAMRTGCSHYAWRKQLCKDIAMDREQASNPHSHTRCMDLGGAQRAQQRGPLGYAGWRLGISGIPPPLRVWRSRRWFVDGLWHSPSANLIEVGGAWAWLGQRNGAIYGECPRRHPHENFSSHYTNVIGSLVVPWVHFEVHNKQLSARDCWCAIRGGADNSNCVVLGS